MKAKLVWYNAEDDELGCNVWLDSFFYALDARSIPWYYILIGEL